MTCRKVPSTDIAGPRYVVSVSVPVHFSFCCWHNDDITVLNGA